MRGVWWLLSVVVHGRERAWAQGPVAAAVPTLGEVSLLRAVWRHTMEARPTSGVAPVTVLAHVVWPLRGWWKDITLYRQKKSLMLDIS